MLYVFSVESISAYRIFRAECYSFYADVFVHVKGPKQKLTLNFCTAFLNV